MEDVQKKPTGFAALSPELRRELARKGGKAVPKEKRSFSTNKELASKAGRKGGVSCPDTKRTFFVNRDLASAAGSKGGSASKRKHWDT
jgi:uncharacterized protein